MARHKLGIMYIALSHINRILKANILIQKIHLTVSTYNHQLYTFVYILKIGYKVYNQIHIGELNSNKLKPQDE